MVAVAETEKLAVKAERVESAERIRTNTSAARVEMAEKVATVGSKVVAVELAAKAGTPTTEPEGVVAVAVMVAILGRSVFQDLVGTVDQVVADPLSPASRGQMATSGVSLLIHNESPFRQDSG
jgi:hypothetical protein